MNKRVKLDKVSIRVLPPRVIKLLSQFAYYLKKHNGTVIKLSSKNILQEVHKANYEANFDVLDYLYNQIVDEISSYAPSKPKHKFRSDKALRALGLS